MFRKNKEPVQITLLLALAISGLVGLSVGTVLYSTAKASFHNTMSSFAGSARLQLDLIEQGVRNHLSPAEDILHHMQHLAEVGELDNKTKRELLLLLKGALAAPHQISGIELWDDQPQGLHVSHHGLSDFHIEEEHETDARELDIIEKLAQQPAQIYWDAPYYHEGETELLAYGRLDNTDRDLGTVSTGVSISELSERISKLGREQSMTAFITYGDQQILAHPDLLDPAIFKKIGPDDTLLPISELKTPLLEKIFKHGHLARPPKEDGFVIRRLPGKGDDGYFMFTKTLKGFSPKPWTIGVYSPASAINKYIERMQHSIYIGIVLFLLSLVASIFLAKRIATPIREYI